MLARAEEHKHRLQILKHQAAVAADPSISASRQRCKKLTNFIAEAWPVLHSIADPYLPNWHIDMIGDHLEAVTYGKILQLGMSNRLRVNQPPGTMKSLMVNVFWTAYEWGPAGMPYLTNTATSFREDYCKRDCRRVRDLVLSDWFQERWPLKLTRTGETAIENEFRGNYETVPFISLTGGRAHRVKIDDPHSIETAESDKERERVIRTFLESVPSRVIDPITSAIILVMQRLHENDCSGIEIERHLGYLAIMLPMEFEPERRCVTPFGRDPRSVEGELLFPTRFPREIVERDKAAMTAYAVAGQYQQRPSPRRGGIFDKTWFPIVPAAPAHAIRVRGWDLAATEASAFSEAAETAGIKMSWADGVFYIEDVVAAQKSPAGVEAMIKNTASQDGLNVVISIPQDPGQAGKAQVAAFAKLLVGYVMRFSPESGDKVQRALPFAAQAEVGNVRLVKGPWNDSYLEQLALFPGGRHKDKVDASSRAFAQLLSMIDADIPALDVIHVAAARPETP